MSRCALFLCVAPVFVQVVERKRKGEMWETRSQSKRMRRRKRWDLWSHLFTRGLSGEQPFTIVNHLHWDILKTQMDGTGGLWCISNMSMTNTLKDCGWKRLRFVDSDNGPKANKSLNLHFFTVMLLAMETTTTLLVNGLYLFCVTNTGFMIYICTQPKTSINL